MNKKLFLLILLIFVLMFIGCNEQDEPADQNDAKFLTYENTEQGVRIEYPETWTKSDFFLTPNTFIKFSFKESSLHLAAVPFEGSAPSDEEAALKQMEETYNYTYSKTFGESFKVLESKIITLDGNPALEYSFSTVILSKPVEQTQITSIKNNKIYMVVAVQPSETTQKMIDSFEFI